MSNVAQPPPSRLALLAWFSRPSPCCWHCPAAGARPGRGAEFDEPAALLEDERNTIESSSASVPASSRSTSRCSARRSIPSRRSGTACPRSSATSSACPTRRTRRSCGRARARVSSSERAATSSPTTTSCRRAGARRRRAARGRQHRGRLPRRVAGVPMRVVGANPDFDVALLEALDPDEVPDVRPSSSPASGCASGRR
jgi:hypothetical protein